ncbi:MAG TPA: hypothetical protein VFU07_07395 [Candidatus Lumbricidophila sp.]|nr:hypothetical protein [Candidatus Lumbricidophila sp.]
MRKYLFSGAILSALAAGLGLVKATARGPRDWRLVLTWVAWAASAAIAIGTVAQDAKRHELRDE